MANQIQLVMYEGFLADAPDMKYTPSGKPVANFRMGSNRKYKNAEGAEVKETTWLKVAVWGKLAEIVNQYCGKGSHVIVTGILRGDKSGNPSVYQMKSGDYAASFEITANEVRIIKGVGVETAGGATAVSDDDVPF